MTNKLIIYVSSKNHSKHIFKTGNKDRGHTKNTHIKKDGKTSRPVESIAIIGLFIHWNMRIQRMLVDL